VQPNPGVASPALLVYISHNDIMIRMRSALVAFTFLTLGCTSTQPTVQRFSFAAPNSHSCQPPSPQRTSEGGLTEVHGSADGAELWALVFRPMPVTAGHETKIVWRMTDDGPIDLTAKGQDGSVVHSNPFPHNGSGWSKPGDEWGTLFTFPSPGCWRVHASRRAVAGDVYFMVTSDT
jgi:hypothetical protein